ncbi:WXG100 family type VII secretion target [Streptosporangium sp. NPDC051023]|uniref:WXG100 family type VII secretion target n=1 Tax=Streptosporangium sp. NPDC051023 TaxID=3155410 RepID=UPI00344FF910
MPDFFNASIPQMELAAAEVEDTAQRIHGMRQRVGEYTAALLRTWRGPASQKYGIAMHAWDEEAQKILTSLQEIAAKLGQSSITYSSVDEDVAGGAGMVDSLINGAK